LWPFIRQHVLSTSAQMGLPPMVLPMLVVHDGSVEIVGKGASSKPKNDS